MMTQLVSGYGFTRMVILKCEGTFINGKPEGLWRKYNADGTIFMIINYRFGEVISFVQTDKLTEV